ncbi:hypothetical protein BKA58DRAFT_406197 [Alternaria rosae]|uniref:uncharacterized protein n=1 Tax=Alternaria rosae TaxID=1187941 RepID=UPI001E8CC082|nr:uncharacterized protein BKA58DRAFT_406197 [Alternaria rosae]KAH6857432.1 hypothetical protein BKA58DRAFT_406197 [Alternaria rosae]
MSSVVARHEIESISSSAIHHHSSSQVLLDLGIFCTSAGVTVKLNNIFHVMVGGAVWLTTSEPPTSTNRTISNFPKLPIHTIPHRNFFAMSSQRGCMVYTTEYQLAEYEIMSAIHNMSKHKYEEDLKAVNQELYELKQETRRIFDIGKENKKIICTNKINDLTAESAQLDDKLSWLDEQIQRLKEELKPPPPLSQSELAERKARHEAHMRAKLARTHG